MWLNFIYFVGVSKSIRWNDLQIVWLKTEVGFTHVTILPKQLLNAQLSFCSKTNDLEGLYDGEVSEVISRISIEFILLSVAHI